MNMLLPDSWLDEYLETDATPPQIKDCLSLCGPSVERINKVNNDFVYEIEITSNRVDMASVFGIAREAAAILPRFGIKAELISPGRSPFGHLPGVVKPKDTSGVAGIQSASWRTQGGGSSKTLPMEVSDPHKLCDRLLAVVLDNVHLGSSPSFIKDRLEKSGVRSLNNLIDITNYVMLELGHPCHVFDYDRIKTGKLILRRAKKGEYLITLDNKKCELSSADVIIDDGAGRIIDLPGIMGTANSVVTPQTKRIVFFIESNNPVNIRRTSMKLGLRTMAATINEKHPDPELVKIAMLRGIELYQKIAGGKVAGEIIDIYPNKSKPVTIKTTVEFINERLGIELKVAEIVSILKSLSFKVKTDVIPNEVRNLSTSLSSHSREIPRQARDDKLIIIPPSFRQFDITIPEDIVEEVARIYGYHNLPSRLMEGEIPISDKPKDLPIEEEIKKMLKYLGFSEVYNYSFTSEDLLKKADIDKNSLLKIANPLTEETKYMRVSLIPSMLQTAWQNQHLTDQLQLFELSKVYLPQKNKLPDEVSLLVLVTQAGFYQLKGIVEILLKELGITDYSLSEKNDKYWHPKQVVSFVKDNHILATLGKVHPTFSHNFDIKKDLYLSEINVDLLVKYYNPIKKYTLIPLYPPVLEDLTFVLPQKSQVGFIIDEIYKTSPLIKAVQIADSFKNNITFRITYQSETKNLSSEEVKSVREQILQHLSAKFQAVLKQK